MSPRGTLQAHLDQPRSSTEHEVAELGPWFHNLHLPDGTQTAPGHPLGDFPSFKWDEIAPHLPEDLTGWEALDVGCNAGFYTFQLAGRGARLLSIDVDEHYLRQARWAAEKFGLSDRVQFQRMEVYDLARMDRRFDLILFMGVFYHLRYPLLALDVLASRVRKLMVFQSLTMPCEDVYDVPIDLSINDRHLLCDPSWPGMSFIEHNLAGDPTNWWAPNRAGVEAMLRSSGLRILSEPGHEIYLCEPDPDAVAPAAPWVRSQYTAATGS